MKLFKDIRHVKKFGKAIQISFISMTKSFKHETL